MLKHSPELPIQQCTKIRPYFDDKFLRKVNEQLAKEAFQVFSGKEMEIGYIRRFKSTNASCTLNASCTTALLGLIYFFRK